MIAPQPELFLDADGLCAYLRLHPWVDYSHLNEKAIIRILESAHVVITDDRRERAQSFCRQLQEGLDDQREFLIAQGLPPQPPVDAKLELSPELDCHSAPTPRKIDAEPTPRKIDADQVDFHARCRLALVKAGQRIGRIVPPRHAVHGTDLFGKTILAKGKPAELAPGQGVELGDDGETLTATRAGLVHIREGSVEIAQVVEIPGDVDFTTGNIDAECDVSIKGTVRDLFEVRSTKAISIGGAIESARVEADGDIEVGGGIAGRERGVIRAGGRVVCRYCDGADVEAKGDITIVKEAIGSTLHTRGRLAIPRGPLIGGRAYARLGAEIHEIGSDADVPTELIIGLDPAVLAKAYLVDLEVARRREATERTHEALAPLLAEAKRLSPEQRARATQLVQEMKTLQESVDELAARKERMLQAYRPPQEPILEVIDCLHPRVTLIFEDLKFVARELIKGPVRICRQSTGYGTVMALFCIHKLSGSRRQLLCRKYTPALVEAGAAETPT